MTTASSQPQSLLDAIRQSTGFIAALDQSGGSTPKALKLYGVDESEYSGDEEMFAVVHAMRTRIMTCECFTSDRIMAAILFENTMEREVQGQPTAAYLTQKGIIPLLKVDRGLADETNGVQLMKPMPELDRLLERAIAKGIRGTKMRSVIKHHDNAAIGAVVEQQFDIGQRIIAHGLVPIIEPEVDIHAADKSTIEDTLKNDLSARLDALDANQHVILKLTLPEQANHYRTLVDHPRVLKVAALSGGYSRAEANRRLGENHGMIASFSRALTEGLAVNQSDAAFASTLGASIDAIVTASRT